MPNNVRQSKTIRARKNREILSSNAQASKVYIVPTYIASSVCPYCNEVQSTEILVEQIGGKVLDNCSCCGEDYYLAINKNNSNG